MAVIDEESASQPPFHVEDAALLRQCIDSYRTMLHLRRRLDGEHQASADLVDVPAPDELLLYLDAGENANVRIEAERLRALMLDWFQQPQVREMVWRVQADGKVDGVA